MQRGIVTGKARAAARKWTNLVAALALFGAGSVGTAVLTATPAAAATDCASPCRLFNPPSPSTPSQIDGGDNLPVELGVQFQTDVPGSITGIQFYKAAANTGTHVGNLWDPAGSHVTPLATGTFTGETASGWQLLTFASPVPIAAGHTYIASYFAPNSHYSFSPGGLPVTNGHLTALDSSFNYGATSAYPGNNNPFTNYWVDVSFVTPSCGPSCFVNEATGNDGNSGTAGSPLKTIQAGVGAVDAGGTVHVANGTYVENVKVTKAMTIDGASQAGVVVEPAASNPNCVGGSLCGGTASVVFLVQASNVTISHLTVNGDGPTVSGVVVGGADIDATDGIETDFNSGTFNNLSVHNATVKNIYLRGIENADGAGFNASSNTIDNVQGDTVNQESIGIFNDSGAGIISANTVSNTTSAVATNHSLGTTMSNNIVTTSGVGVHSDNNGDGAGATPDSITGNQVTCSSTASDGVFVFVPYLNQTVSGNTVSGCGNGLAEYGSCNFAAGFGGNACPGGVVPTTTFTNNSATGGTTGLFVTTDTLGFGDAQAKVAGDHNTLTPDVNGVSVVETGTSTATVAVNRNSLAADSAFGVTHTGATNVDATCNWWGASSGPGPVGPGSGSKVTTGVTFAPALVTSDLNGICAVAPPVIGSIASAGVGAVSVSFTAGPTGGSPFTSFTATCTSLIGQVGGTTTVPAAHGSPIVVTGLAAGTPYTCTVTETNGVGTSAPSGTTSVVFPAMLPSGGGAGSGGCTATPTAPRSPSAASGNASATVSWAPPLSGCIAGYIVTPYLNGVAQSPTLIPGHGTTTVVKGLINGDSYTFTVSAENGIVTGPASPMTNAITIGVPSAASAVKVAKSGSGAVKVSFSAARSNGSAISSYTATCTSSNGGKTKANAAKSSPITVTGLTRGKVYTCAVTATNHRGTGRASVRSAAITA